MRKYQSKSFQNKLSIILLFLIFFYELSSSNPLVFSSKINFSSLNDSVIVKNKFLRKIELVNSLTPVLKWFRVEGSKKYFLVLKEYEDSLFDSQPVIIRTYEIADTFFSIPPGTLDEGKFYSWNVKSFNGKLWSDFGDEYYFRIKLKSSITKQEEKKPKTHSPGKFYPNIEIIKTLMPEFVWFRDVNAIAYKFNLEKKEHDGTFKKIYSSDEFGLIKDTSFILRGNLLKEGIVYRWNIGSSMKSGFSSLSEFRYFKIILPKIKVRPEALYPGYKKENKEIIATSTPTFVWRKIKDAVSYSIAISKKDSDGKYKLIFDSENKFQLSDTTFKIPEGILENNSFYRWNLKVNLKDGRTLFSSRLYFRVIISEQRPFEIKSENLEQEKELEEILLNMEYAGIVKTLISSIFYDDKIYISIQEFLYNLHIPFNKIDGYTYEGSFNENAFVIDFKNKTYSIAQSLLNIEEKDFLEYNDDYFLTTQLIEKFLPVKIELDFSNLTLLIQSEEQLPIYRKFLIEQKFVSMQKKSNDKTVPLLFNRDRYVLNGFVFDYTIAQSLIKNQRNSYFYSAALGGELFYGDFYISRQEYIYQNYRNRIENYNWKLTLNPNNYLSQISIGDEYLEGINSYLFRGINITNEVVEPRNKIGNYIYQDKTEPNSLVELYINNEIVNITKSNQSGDFTFEIPLRYGMSILELRIHTLKGETKIVRKIFQIPYEFLPRGIFNYRLSAGLMRFVNNRLAYSELSYGVTDFLTISAGGEYIRDSLREHKNFFGKTSFRISSNVLFNLFYSPGVYSRIHSYFVFPDYTSYTFEFLNYRENTLYNLAGLKNSFRGSFFLPFKMQYGDLSFFFNHEFHEAKSFKRYNLSVNSFYLYKWFSINAGFLAENLHSNTIYKIRDWNFGLTFNLNNLLRDIPVLNRSYLNLRSTYNYVSKRFQSFSLFSTTTLMNNIRLQFNYLRLVQIKSNNFSLSLLLELPQARYMANSNGSDVLNHQMSGSIGYSPQINHFYFYSEPLIGRSSVYLEGFEDKNENNIKDDDEKTVKGLDFSINSATYSKKIKDGKIFVGLNPYQHYTVRLIETGITSPNYSFELPEFNIVTDGSRVKIIRLPYRETGEIGGLVVRKFEGEEIPLPNVRLILKNLDNERETTVTTFSDGSFYLFGLTKGKYILRIDENYLRKTSFKSFPEKIEFEINPEKDEIMIENLKIILE